MDSALRRLDATPIVIGNWYSLSKHGRMPSIEKPIDHVSYRCYFSIFLSLSFYRPALPKAKNIFAINEWAAILDTWVVVQTVWRLLELDPVEASVSVTVSVYFLIIFTFVLAFHHHCEICFT